MPQLVQSGVAPRSQNEANGRPIQEHQERWFLQQPLQVFDNWGDLAFFVKSLITSLLTLQVVYLSVVDKQFSAAQPQKFYGRLTLSNESKLCNLWQFCKGITDVIIVTEYINIFAKVLRRIFCSERSFAQFFLFCNFFIFLISWFLTVCLLQRIFSETSFALKLFFILGGDWSQNFFENDSKERKCSKGSFKLKNLWKPFLKIFPKVYFYNVK